MFALARGGQSPASLARRSGSPMSAPCCAMRLATFSRPYRLHRSHRIVSQAMPFCWISRRSTAPCVNVIALIEPAVRTWLGRWSGWFGEINYHRCQRLTGQVVHADLHGIWPSQEVGFSHAKFLEHTCDSDIDAGFNRLLLEWL